MKVQGLTVYVYKNPLFKNCSLNGISSRYDSLILIGEGVEGPNTVDLDNPPENVVKLVKRRIYAGIEYLHVEPLDGIHAGGKKFYSDGGAFCYSSDSRFPSHQPLSIHDRCEE